MDKFLSLTVGGLATAAIYAVAASGLVLTYTTTGTSTSPTVRSGWWPLPLLAAPLRLGVADADRPRAVVCSWRARCRRGLGAGDHAPPARGRRRRPGWSPRYALLLGLLGTAVYVWEPGVARPLRQFFQGNVVEPRRGPDPLVPVRFPGDGGARRRRAAPAALPGTQRRGHAGGSRQPGLAALNGARPERSAMLAWALGCSLAALSGILIAPTLSLSAVPLTLLIVNAYGAAVFGRLRACL